MERARHALRSLPAQMVLTSIALVLLTAIAAGVPSAWLVRGKAQEQAWARVQQGMRATEALYAANLRELTALATLTAQRPTLRTLVDGGDASGTWSYLEELRGGAGLDLVAVCDGGGNVLSAAVSGLAVPAAGPDIDSTICRAGESAGHIVSYMTDQDGSDPSSMPGVWLLAGRAIDPSPSTPGATVVVGSRMTDDAASSLFERTGLEQSLILDGKVVATSLPGGSRTGETSGNAASRETSRLSVGGLPYYVGRTPLTQVAPSLVGTAEGAADEGATREVALPVSDVAAAERRLLLGLAAGIVLVATAGSVLAALLSRRISRPLESLVAAAEALREGELSVAVPDVGEVREISLVARALEVARQDLRRTLDELREEKTWTDELLEAIVEGIVTLDDEGRITYISSGAERITGARRGNALGLPCDEIMRPSDTDRPLADVMPLPGRRATINVTFADGRRATLAVTGAHLMPPDQGSDRTALVFRDVTDAESMHRVMGHFLANVSHEFLTPLTALAASTELLRDQAPDLSRDEMQELLIALHVGILKLHTLVDNLLEGASIEAGRFDVSVQPVTLDQIVAEAVSTMRPLLDRQGQRLVTSLPEEVPVVLADRRRTTQVVVNLLSNASRYGPDESDIELGADVTGPSVRVYVADRGPGVPAGQRDSVFHRFVYRGAGDDRSLYGAGLGLSVVKAIVESQGGKVGVEARAGGGAEFWFTLPVAGDA
ncbi:MAG: ATP-binding protein [Anaerolineae bacterium]